jgi:hypothetical protein
MHTFTNVRPPCLRFFKMYVCMFFLYTRTLKSSYQTVLSPVFLTLSPRLNFRPARTTNQRVPHGEVLRQLQRTLQFLQYSELSTFDGVDLMKACSDIGMHKSVELQNDTSEYFQRLLEKLVSALYMCLSCTSTTLFVF